MVHVQTGGSRRMEQAASGVQKLGRRIAVCIAPEGCPDVAYRQRGVPRMSPPSVPQAR